MTAYITLEHEKKSKSTKTQPSSLNNINENDPKAQPPADSQQTMNRNSGQMNLSTPVTLFFPSYLTLSIE
mgnify:CR=1 FL=1